MKKNAMADLERGRGRGMKSIVLGLAADIYLSDLNDMKGVIERTRFVMIEAVLEVVRDMV